MNNLKIFGTADERTIEQAANCLAVEEGARGVLCADNHLGYAQPVGMAVAYRDNISVSGVGYDIGCGNKAVKTNLSINEMRSESSGRSEVPAIMAEITDKISFGIGPNRGQQAPDHPVIDEIADAEISFQRDMVDKARDQLSTVGAGNHYVDLFVDDGGTIWVGVHFGSRGFGHTTATAFLNLAAGRSWNDGGGSGESVMDKPVVLPTSNILGQAYIEAMELCGRYAYAGRDIVCDRVLDILGAESVVEVHNHHNFAWREEHFGEDLWVIRKGCTPAFPGQLGFVGATMGEDSVILEGADHGFQEHAETQEEALFSTVHGAGRAMSRTEAAGKKRKRWSCQNRDCDWIQPPRTHKPEDGACPVCGTAGLKKRWIQEREGKINWSAANEDLAEKGIVLRGGAADEAPLAYKRLTEVLESQGDTINVLNTLHPIGVAMAGPDVNDPFKD